MGFVEKVKNVISKLRAAGKTEKEVSEIIEQAAEAATVLKKTESPEHPEKIKAAGGENLQDALLKVGISAKEALNAFESIYRLRRQVNMSDWHVKGILTTSKKRKQHHTNIISTLKSPRKSSILRKN